MSAPGQWGRGEWGGRGIRSSAHGAALALALVAGACGGKGATNPTESSQGVASGTPAESGVVAAPRPATVAGPVKVKTESWVFEGRAGSVLRTDHFSIYTTETDPVLVERLPRFLEAALGQYSSVITPLALPKAAMDTFIMANRPQWQDLTVRMLGARARPMTLIERGGFTTGGRSFLYNIGTNDTFLIAAHEGWHQFTQSAFTESMPVWIEEGLATHMEGHRWSGQGVLFLPWGNTERYNGLVTAASKRSLLTLEELLTATPQSLMDRPGNSNEPAVAFYSQVWALVHFLQEGEGGRYKQGLANLLADAQAGRMIGVLRLKMGARAGAISASPLVFRTYFNDDLAQAGKQFAAFQHALVQPQMRGPVIAGVSPFGGVAPVFSAESASTFGYQGSDGAAGHGEEKSGEQRRNEVADEVPSFSLVVR